eukprot:TRINITY_DN751_c0_g1_i1.p1 TRINITY_DN751_c0_g1~~TRINITY_DN751_c0_g1_i1.p1  ORF type:complete len:319 (+),score=97.35 TRINITY_DN751_c0_g1_i1:190-1146(+)
MEGKVAALSNIFPNVRMGTIVKVLSENNWQQETAIEVLLNMTAEEERKVQMIKKINEEKSTEENPPVIEPVSAPPRIPTPTAPVPVTYPVISELNQNQPNEQREAIREQPQTQPSINNNNNAWAEPLQFLQDLRNFVTRSETWAISMELLSDLKKEIGNGLNELMAMVKEGGLGAEEKRAKLESRLRELQEINRIYEEERQNRWNSNTTQPSNTNPTPTPAPQPTVTPTPVVNNVQPAPSVQQARQPPSPSLSNFVEFTPAPAAYHPQFYPGYPPLQQPYYQPYQQQQQQAQARQQAPPPMGYQPYYPYPYYYEQPRK